jgi:hypothetical protein
MLFNPKWKVQTKPDVFSLEGLIAWLEKQPAERTYCFEDNGGCLLAQYYLSQGYSQVGIGGTSVTLDGKYRQMPDAFSDIPADHPRTFGGALSRARAALSKAR